MVISRSDLTYFASALTSLVLLALAHAHLTAAPPGGSQAPASPDQAPQGLEKSDWAGIRSAHSAWQHGVMPAGGEWQARNPGQQWTTRFDGRGFLTSPKDGGWTWGLELQSYGRGPNQKKVNGKPGVKAEGQRMSYQWDATLQEWWVNDQRGLEHGFTLSQRPEAGDHHVTLELTLTTRGPLTARISEDARGLRFVDEEGAPVVNYSGLKVWDADGQVLTSRFEVAADASLHLYVDDATARYPITIDPVAQQAYLKASNTEGGDRFGNSVAMSGDTVVIGASLEDSTATGVDGNQANNSATDAGAVYVFTRSGTTWSQQAYLKASNTGAGDTFGCSVAVSGDTLVIGASAEDSSATGVNGNQADNAAANSGAVYVFTRSGTIWSQEAYLKASNTGANDAFGSTVAVSGDTAIIGAAAEDSSATAVNGNQADNAATNSGAVYVFTRSGSTWSQQAYLKASNTGANDAYGSAVSVSGDTAVIGAPLEDSNAMGIGGTQSNNSSLDAGAVYVLTRSGSTWSQQAYVKASNTGAGDRFGASVSVSGDTAVIGATAEDSNATGVDGSQSNNTRTDSGAAYVLTRSGSTWSQQAYVKASNSGSNDSFGAAVVVSGDTIIIGATGEDSDATGTNGDETSNSASQSGAAYLFTRIGTTWAQRTYLKASNSGSSDFFGTSVAVSGDTAIIGAIGEASSATGADGDQVDNSAANAGAAYIFNGFGPPPTVTTVNPATGSIYGGTFVTITGTNFTGATSVTFGGDAATSFTVNSATEIIAESPYHAEGAVSVEVTTDMGTSAANTLFTYGVPPYIDLNGVSPNVGTTAGGTHLTITGSGFTAHPVTVTMNDVAVTNVVVVDDNTITCDAPPGERGYAYLEVANLFGSAEGFPAFLYIGPPILDAIAPASGGLAGGTQVTLTGTDFDDVTSVTFNGVPATDVTFVHFEKITCTTPPGSAGPASVLITTPFGINPANTLFTYAAVPFTRISPTSGSVAGGTLVTLTGENFTGATSVTFDGTPATNLTVVNATTITCRTPAHVAGRVNVVVTTPGGTGTGISYTYISTGQGFGTGQPASIVVGQHDFTGFDPTQSQSVTNSPTSVAVSSLGALAVVDLEMSRILLWNHLPIVNGEPADVVLGQTNFDDDFPGSGASELRYPAGVTFSPDGQKLLVADYDNNRVLIWNSIPTSNGAPADVVIGQSTFTTRTSGTSQTRLRRPGSVFVTVDGKLLVADTGNNRVLVYNSVPTSNLASADVVIGQADFTTRTTGSTADKFANIGQITVSPTGKLVVADYLNSRVVIFNSIPTTNGASADVVIGQPDFATTEPMISQTRMVGPFGVAISPAGQLAVGDFVGNRVLLYDTIPTSNGVAADAVLGQADFATADYFAPTSGPNSTGMYTADDLAFSADGRLWVSGRNMRRVMVFGSTPPVVNLATPAVGSSAGGTTVTVTGSGLSAASSVTFDGIPATNVVVVDGTKLTCTSPAHALGAVSVVVTTPLGTSSANSLFTYVAPGTLVPSSVPAFQIGGTGFSNETTLYDYTVQAGTNRILIVTASHATDSGIVSVTFDGLPLTLMVDQGTGASSADSIWVRAMGTSATPVTGDIVFTRSDNFLDDMAMTACVYENADQATPMNSPQVSSASSSTNVSSSVTVVSEAGDVVFDLISIYSAAAPRTGTPGGDQTLKHGPLAGETATWIASTKPGAASVVMSWTTNGDYVQHLAANINRYAPGPPVITPSTTGIFTTATALTIHGGNFSLIPGENTVVFSPAGTGTVTASTGATLTVTGVSGLTIGALNAVVTTNGMSSASAQVATVSLPRPGDVTPLDLGIDGGVTATVVQPDGKTIIAGVFGTILGVNRSCIARINADGTLDTSFDPNPDGVVYAVALQPDGKLILGGVFDSLQPNGAATPTARSKIARVNADGTLDMGFNPRANDTVYSLAIEADGQVVIGGLFTTLRPNNAASPTTRRHMARVNADGTLDGTFDPNPDELVSTVVVQPDGKVLLAGGFTTLQPGQAGPVTPRNCIARVNVDGTLDAQFDPNADSIVNSVALQADGKVLLGGNFTSLQPNGAVSPTPRNYVARVNVDGTLDTGFDPNVDGDVISMAVQADGKVLLGGMFTSLQPNNAPTATTRNNFARVNMDGSLDTGIDANVNKVVFSVALQADGKVLLGGFFTSLQPNGATTSTPRRSFAQLLNDAATQTITAADTSQVLWSRGGAAPELSQVTFEQSTDGGTNWFPLGAGLRVGTTASWQLTNLSLPANVSIRAQGRTHGGYLNGSSGRIQQVADFTGLVSSAPEIAVEFPQGTNLVSGSASVAFGTANVGGMTQQTFTVKNTGAGPLNLGAITFDGTHAADFVVSTAPATPVAAGNGITTFEVTFRPLGSGSRNAVMHIVSNDSSRSPFNITVTGRGTNIFGGTWMGPPLLSTSGAFDCRGVTFAVELGFMPTQPFGPMVFIHADGGIIGNFNELPEGGVVAMAFNGVIHYFQISYGENDITLTPFTPEGPAAWKWVSGPSSRNGAGIYGTLGTAAPSNNPGARQGGMNWLAQDGSLWMFGGYGYATGVTNPPRYLNDLWQYDRVLGQWVWRGGSNAPNQFGVYGTQDEEAAANAPGSRHTGTTWTDVDGNLWLFGGFGVGTGVGAASLNDLWRFNMSTGLWTWMKGSTVTGAAPVHGTQNVAAAANTPGARSSATGFYSNGSLWLFGGYTGTAYYNDLWRYDIASGNWAWVSGSSAPNQNGVYGEQGETAPGNSPGARRDATGWVAKDGRLWLFGGLGLAVTGATAGDLNDLWSFNPGTGEWTWIKGSNGSGAAGVYGARDTPAAGNLPGARSAGSGWATVDGDLWLIGGFKDSSLTFNDVWIYDITTNMWTWKQGAAGTLSVPGVYGTQGTAAQGNQPGGRFTPSTWVTLNGSLWIFGGGGADSFGNTGRLSDLWSYGISNPSPTPMDNSIPDAFAEELIVNTAPDTSDTTAGTMAYVPVSGQLTGTDLDGDRVLFNAASTTAISQGKLTLNKDGTWTYTPAYGFTGTASFQFKASDDYGGQSALKTLVITVITNPADSDGDGIADVFEQQVWGSLIEDGDGDADLDGQSNYFEFLAQTDPLDAGERLLTAPTVNAQGSVLSLNHVRPGVNYHLETSVNLEDWSRIGTFTFTQAGSATIEPQAAPAGVPVFYRVSLEATPQLILP